MEIEWEVEDLDVETKKTIEEKVTEKIEMLNKDTTFQITVSKDKNESNTALVSIYHKDDFVVQGKVIFIKSGTTTLWSDKDPDSF